MIFNMSGGGGGNQELQVLDEIAVTREIIEHEAGRPFYSTLLTLYLPDNLTFGDVKGLCGNIHCEMCQTFEGEGSMYQATLRIEKDSTSNYIYIYHARDQIAIGSGEIYPDENTCIIYCADYELHSLEHDEMFGKVYY